MDLPVISPAKPMLAKAVPDVPDLGHTEHQWDGFRYLVFKDGDEVELASCKTKPLTRQPAPNQRPRHRW